MRQDADRMTDRDTLQLVHQRVRDRRVIPFIGAGISQPVLQKGWEDTIREVANKARGLLSVSRKEFDAVLKSPGRGPTVAAEILRQELEGKPLAEAVRKVLIRRGQRPDPAHLAMVTGPWPAMVTTNWDDFLEAAWAKGSATEEAPGQAHRAWGKRLRVFYRADIESFHAHLKAGVRPLLFKMHGDFSNPEEFVLGETDYRRLLVRDISLRSLMLLLTAEYSLLFYGCSMTDPDVLEFLAATHEGLGHGIGPHFWLTFDEVPRPLSHFLLRHYNLRVLRVDEAELLPALHNIADAGWDVPCSTAVSVRVNRRVTVHITGDPMPHVSQARAGETFAISVGTTKTRVVVPSTEPDSQMVKVLGTGTAADGVVLDDDGVGTCEVDGKVVWLVSGQEPGRYGRTGHVHRAVRALMDAAVTGKATWLHLPLIAAGGGHLPARESLHAMLHAIGAAADQVRAPSCMIVIHAYQPAGEFSPMGDIADGRIVPARILERGRTGRVRCAAIHPAPDDLRRVVCSSVFASTDGTVSDLLEQLRLPERPPAGRWRLRYQRGDGNEVELKRTSLPLNALDITDGALIAIESSK
jgi:hypothetical protein